MSTKLEKKLEKLQHLNEELREIEQHIEEQKEVLKSLKESREDHIMKIRNEIDRNPEQEEIFEEEET